MSTSLPIKKDDSSITISDGKHFWLPEIVLNYTSHCGDFRVQSIRHSDGKELFFPQTMKINIDDLDNKFYETLLFNWKGFIMVESFEAAVREADFVCSLFKMGKFNLLPDLDSLVTAREMVIKTYSFEISKTDDNKIKESIEVFYKKDLERLDFLISLWKETRENQLKKLKENGYVESQRDVIHIQGYEFKIPLKELKKQEFGEICDFINHLQDYGHIFHLDPKLLDEPFRKILEGMAEIEKMMDDSYGM